MNINLQEIGNKSLLRFSYKQANDQLHLSAVLPKQGATATKTSLENKHLANGDYFLIIASSCIFYSSKTKKHCEWNWYKSC